MNKILVFRNLLFLLAFTFVVSCSKKSDEVTPSLLTGKWKQNGVIGKITATANGKTASQDINEPADNSIVEFKADGTGTFEGDAMTYKTSGSILTITLGGQSVEFTSKVSGSNLTLSFTKDQFLKILELTNGANDPTLVAFKALTITEFVWNINYLKQ